MIDYKKIAIGCMAILAFACGGSDDGKETPGPEPGVTPPSEDTPDLPVPDPEARLLYNGIELPAVWPPKVPTSQVYDGMSPFYLDQKPAVIDISLGRQLFVDDFLIASTSLQRQWHRAEYHAANPVLTPEKEWEFYAAGGGSAAPFSDGVWYDERDAKFKMWYMAGGKTYGDGNIVTCYAESTDGIVWTRPSLNVVAGTNIVHRGKERDSNSVWIDKQTDNESQRYRMFNVYGGAGNWKYHYLTSSDGKAWREQNESGSVADRSTVFHNPFRGVWVWSMRHNVRVDASNLVRARDYVENAAPAAGNRTATADLEDFWFGPWPSEPVHPVYSDVRPAIYNLDAIAYESILLGTLSVWSGPENDICTRDGVIKRNQLLLGYSRDGWSWHREDFEPFCAVSDNAADWNFGNLQSAVGSPLIVGDRLYFYLSGRRFGNDGKEIVSTGLATLRRDGFASMNGSGELITEPLKFSGKYLYVNAKIGTSLRAEILDSSGNPIEGFKADDCRPLTGDGTALRISWTDNDSLAELEGQTIRIRFVTEACELYAFWISRFEDGRSYGYTAGGGPSLGVHGMDL